MAKRIIYIDGLKGLCGIWVCLFHYLLAFASFGYIGWESGVADADKAAYYCGWPRKLDNLTWCKMPIKLT